ncbi:hypothetical protein [Paenibacillus durus]|uniref:MacB-like periplasmic core domain-containing protein n=1 Tax=Paenibacillus durus ATCC 35681 TaxID=1333534 RepID=A0A0F7FB69_PAEDU|nr:hypothetical protein [Paenibacillus durus]AKG35999.1 hypothetical protein VK70_16720 [Paenibacillus durus ATCC 35681]
MIIRELKHYFFAYKATIIFLVLHLTAFFILVGTFLTFIEQLNYESKHLQNIYDGKAVYQLLDGYYDGEDYQNFISRPNYLSILKNYYKELNSASNFNYLAMFDHPILLKSDQPLEPFGQGYERGAEINRFTSGTEVFTEVKSLQINEKVPVFFELKAEDGRLWNQQDFENPQEIMPVVMGNSYKSFFKIGEKIEIEYYGEIIKAKIIGFLKKNSKIYYQASSEFYLDEHLLLPYQSHGNPVTKEDELFQRKNYFAMDNGYIITDNTPKANQLMMQRVEAISKKTSFGSYSFINLNPHFAKYRGLLTVMLENKGLAFAIFITTLVLNIIIISIIFLLQQKRRFASFYVHYINGASQKFLLTSQWLEISSLLLVACIFSGVILRNILKIGEISILIYMLGICIMMIFIIHFLIRNGLKKTYFLKTNDDERN